MSELQMYKLDIAALSFVTLLVLLAAHHYKNKCEFEH